MSAQPVHHEPDSRDPQVVRAHHRRARFLTEYHAAVDGLHVLSDYRKLNDLLHTWDVLAFTYGRPDFQRRYTKTCAPSLESMSAWTRLSPHTTRERLPDTLPRQGSHEVRGIP